MIERVGAGALASLPVSLIGDAAPAPLGLATHNLLFVPKESNSALALFIILVIVFTRGEARGVRNRAAGNIHNTARFVRGCGPRALPSPGYRVASPRSPFTARIRYTSTSTPV